MLNVSIRMKMVILIIITVITVSIAMMVQSVSTINEMTKENIENYKKEAYKSKELELKNYVSVALKSIEFLLS